MDARAHHPGCHALAEGVSMIPGLTLRTELRRKFLHMLPGLLPFIFASIPHRDPLSPAARNIVLTAAATLTILVLLNRRSIARQGETGWMARVLSYPATVLATLLIFPANAEFAAVAVVVLAFGDGAASLGGMGVPSPRLPWNPRKTRAGFASFMLCATPLAVLAYWCESQPAVPLAQAVACGSAAALAGAIAESLPLRVNDNLRVGIASATVVAITHFALTGPA